MIPNEKIHTSNVIASLSKIYNQSKLNGRLHSEDIYILDAIYKLMNGCETAISDFQKRTLNSLYNNIINKSKYICSTSKFKNYLYSSNNFIQAETNDCNNIPTLDLLYYWQEPLGVIDDTILANIATGVYLDTKPSALKSSFVEGKDVTYTDIGLICFALSNVSSTEKYYIFDDDNNADITLGFESFYNDELKTRIFISYNIYSYGLMNFKIKKI